MKNILFTLVLFATSLAFSQELRCTIYEKHWAGGICCRSGVDYSLEFYFPLTEMTLLDSVTVDSPGIRITIPVHKLETTKFPEFVRYKYTCGYSNNRMESISDTDNFYNMTLENKSGSNELSVIYYCFGTTYEITNSTIIHEEIAYP